MRPAIDYRYFSDPDGADQDGFVGPVRHSCICALTDGGVRGPLPPSIGGGAPLTPDARAR